MQTSLLAVSLVAAPALAQYPCLEQQDVSYVFADVGGSIDTDSRSVVDGDRALVIGAYPGTGPSVVALQRLEGFFVPAGTVALTTTLNWSNRVTAALDGDMAAVAYNSNVGPNYHSLVFVLRHDGAAWGEVTPAPLPPAGGLWPYGTTVEVSGEDVLVVAPNERYILIFRETVQGWTLHQSLEPDPPLATISWYTLAATGTRLAALQGGARIAFFERAHETDPWMHAATLPVSLPQSTGNDPFLVAIDDAAAVVARGSAVVVFERSEPGVWAHAETLDTRVASSSRFPYPIQHVELADGLGILSGPAGEFMTFRKDWALGRWAWSGSLAPTLTTGAFVDWHFGFDGTSLVVSRSINTRIQVDLARVGSALGDCDADCVQDAVQIAQCAGVCDRNGNSRLDACEQLGARYCSPNAPHGGGFPARLDLVGSASTTATDLAAIGRDLPDGTFAMLVSGAQPTNVPGALGGPGTLCVGGALLGRHDQHIRPVGPEGIAVMPIDPRALPTPFGVHATIPGETWYFQVWYRQGSGANLTDALALTFE